MRLRARQAPYWIFVLFHRLENDGDAVRFGRIVSYVFERQGFENDRDGASLGDQFLVVGIVDTSLG